MYLPKASRPQFNQGNSVKEFYNMFTATGRHLKDLPLSINHGEFNNSYSLNLLKNGEALSPSSNGTLRLEMRFKVPLHHSNTLKV